MSISTFSTTAAKCGGNIIHEGNTSVIYRGLCWSTSPSPTLNDAHSINGNGIGVFNGVLVGLQTNTTYFVRAYATNNNGISYGNEVSFNTGTWECGLPVTINHATAGNVAPIDKIVTYGTVTNIPGEPNKCWITSNLGSDRQATAVNDPTEASAGWYWQFNRKQGYKHDGSNQTPLNWVDDIKENCDWVFSNDPCSIELGNGWRLPTATEWTNVDREGLWTSGTGVWNSLFKLHV